MRQPQRPSVGLVLGAGGVLGAAWLAGALDAIASETGWDPGSADTIVGTSAGSIVGALLASGVPPWLMVAHSAGEELDGLVDVTGEPCGYWSGASFRLHRGPPVPWPGSWRLAVGSLGRSIRHAPTAVLAGVLPDGLMSTNPIRDVVRSACADAWAPHPGLCAVSVDYGSGRRVAFGGPGAPRAALPDAVAASCAIPGFYRSVRIGERRYVDGGVHSTSNLDLLAGRGLDLAICLNPTSSPHARSPRTLGERIAASLRHVAGLRLADEAERVRASGTEVIVIEPTVYDLHAMGSNLMNRSRRHVVLETAVETVSDYLRESPVGKRLSRLPAGRPELVRRPPGLPASWPDLYLAARLRSEAGTDELAA